MDTSTSAHAQIIPISAKEEEFYPEHPPREDTPEYSATHKLLVDTLDQPCHDCGVRKSKLADPTQNPLGAKQLETHHYPLQREYIDAVDWKKVAKDFPEVTDQESLIKFVDSPKNMLVLCDVDHRSSNRGIHHLLTSDQMVKKYLFDGYILDDISENADYDILKDNQIVEQSIPEDERA